MHPHAFHTKQHVKAFHTSTVAYKLYKYEAKLKIGRFTKNTKNPSFPYLLSRAKLLDTDNRDTSAPRTDSTTVEHDHRRRISL